MASSSSKSTEDGIANVQQSHQSKPRWSHLEDAMLLMHVAVNEVGMWKKISDQLRGRSRIACRLRWSKHLSPYIKWEEVQLIAAHSSYRKKFYKKLLRALVEKIRGKIGLTPSTSTSNVSLPSSTIFTDSTIISPPAAADPAGDLPTNSTSTCMACRFNWHSNVPGQRTFMMDCYICRRVLDMGGQTTSMRNANQPPPSFSSPSLNLILATTINSPQPPLRPSLPPPSPSLPSPPTFIDFLGVGSV